MRKAIKVGVAVAIAATMGLMAGVGTASASTVGAQPRFAAEARAAHLSSAQTAKLQDEVSSFIRKHGGTQVALNVVDFRGGNAEFVVPGEKYARDLATTVRPLTAGTCALYYFCIFSGTDYNSFVSEPQINLTLCGNKYLLTYSGEGSYINNQSSGTKSTWYAQNETTVKYVTPGAFVENPEVNWTPVYYVEACP
jgi:ribosomal protein S13